LITGSVWISVLTFFVAATMIVLLMFAASIGAAAAQASTLSRFKTSGPSVKRWGGRILIFVGAWFLVLALFAETVKKVLF
jgi:hypothetical protein